ncbi:HDOD domain-containing protein [Pseudoduganella eburnea]|uniref:HDOD domain-containing protein n=1 Tax=Massilia eburnea TaxID=1776165 RepID=A0A6L6QHA3_9BURK|nr:HDOD domain-containing protein [Massilia eburnea]MTW11454.1 HDOD domain-containing protein [Massilia eburnea]
MEKLRDLATIISEMQRGELVFPTSVNAALSLQLALADPDCHDDEVLRRVLGEPVLAARAVALANATVFRRNGAPPVTSARAAVQRLGYRNLYSLAASMVVRQFGARIRDRALRERAEQLWKFSAHVAAISYQVAQHITRTDPDTALFAGIVHEAGNFYLLSQADQVPGLLDEMGRRLGPVQEIVAREVLRKLEVPDAVAAAIITLRDGAISLPPAGLRDTLLLARHLCPVLSPLPAPQDDYLVRRADMVQCLETFPGLAELLDIAAVEARSMGAALLA